MSAFAEEYIPTNNETVAGLVLDASSPAEHKLFIRGSATGVSIASIVPAPGMEEGSNLCIVNDTPNSITLKHNDTDENAAHRLISSTGLDIVLTAGRPLWGTLVENSTSHPNGWRFEAL